LMWSVVHGSFVFAFLMESWNIYDVLLCD